MGAEGLMIMTFVIGYLLIIFEHPIKIDKTGPALITGIICWSIFILTSHDYHHVELEFMHHLSDIASILFFLMGAMTIVEIIDIHDGFHVIVGKITTTSKRKLLFIVCLLTFFLSAVLDNLTTSIVMASLLQKLLTDKKERLLFAGMVIISANAGGAWSPIGDVTTTMLWIGGQISVLPTIKDIILPSIVCMLVPLAIMSYSIKGTFEKPKMATRYKTTSGERISILIAGISLLLFVPVFKTVTHLPPFMGMFFGVGILWMMTDLLHVRKLPEEKTFYSVFNALSRIDSSSVLFFFGILAAISSLESIGILKNLALTLQNTIGNQDIIILFMGVFSAIVDNVPLVAASMGMYDIATYPMDDKLWQFIAYCTGTGGSMLIIGSAAGVAVMGIEKIDFIWYLKRIGPLALVGYLAGAGVYLLLYSIGFH